MTNLIKYKKASKIPAEGTKVNVHHTKTKEIIAVGTIDDYAIDHQSDKKIGVMFTLKSPLPYKDKEMPYRKYLYDKGGNHIIFHKDGEIYKTKDAILYLTF